MTEQERMKQGYVWQDDDENMSLQAHTKALVREFNSMPPEDMEGREEGKICIRRFYDRGALPAGTGSAGSGSSGQQPGRLRNKSNPGRGCRR